MCKVFYCLIFLAVCAHGVELPSKATFEKFCFDCHADGMDKGEIDFDVLLKNPADKKWAKIWEVIEKEQMPPADKKRQPNRPQREQMLTAIETSVFKIDRSKSNPNSITLFRLSNSQFRNSLYSVFGYRGEAAMMLPTDATSMGFNNIASNMNISPLHFESYRNTARLVSEAIFDPKSRSSAKKIGDVWLKKIKDGKSKTVENLLREITLKAFRRPAYNREISDLKFLYDKVNKAKGMREALREAVSSIILSPSHIFRTELFGIEKEEKGHLLLDEYALASRLSFFLWNMPPDERLLKTAAKGEIRKNLPELVKSMVKDSRFTYFANDFCQQWLHIQSVEAKERSNSVRPIVRAFKNETTEFMKYLFRENRPLTDIFNSKVSFVNDHLAKLYGLKPLKKSGYYKVVFPEDSHRKGILTHPSIHYATSNPDETSPVKRGLWILESILAMPPPPAPANVPAIEEAKKKKAGGKLTHRELLALHREDKRCASCHELMDPLGLAMEHFSKMGKWRTESEGEKINLDEKWRGNSIKSFNDLQTMLATKYAGKFTQCLTEKLMIYGLAKGLDVKDQLVVKQIAEKLTGKDATFLDVLTEVIKSTPFQYRIAGDNNDR